MAEQEMLLAVVVNDKKLTDATLIINNATNGIMVPSQILTRAHLRTPDVAAIRRHNENYYPLASLSGVRVKIEELTQTLNIDAPPGTFIESKFNLDHDDPLPIQAPETGAFVNYDVNYAKWGGNNNFSGLTEIGVFSHGGTLTSRFVGSNFNHQSSVFRLDSQYTKDFPAQQMTLVVGDSITAGSAISRQVYFGGLQWRTKFSTIPGFQVVPLPTLGGTALAPSMVDIYVDNILRLKQPVDTGPFAIENFPVYAGQGDVQMVVRDVLGRQQIYTQSYITSAQLLRQGYQDVSYEVGALRNNFGIKDSHYGRVFGSATMRYGLSDATTVEGHGEIMPGRVSMDVDAVLAVRGIGLLSAGMAASASEYGAGTLQYVQFDRQKTEYGLTLRAQTADARFWQLGFNDQTLNPAKQIQAQTNFAITARTNLRFGYFDQVNRNLDNVRTISAGISFNVYQSGSVSIGLLKSLTQDHLLSANLVWVLPLDPRRFLQVVASGQQSNKWTSIEYQQVAIQEGDWGYRARQTVFDSAGQDLGINYISRYGEYLFGANHRSDQSNTQFEVRGGVAFLGGYARATRWIDQSFAMVEVPVSQPIDIYANNLKVGQTDQGGIGLIPRLIPYEANNVYLGDAGLPLSMTLDLAQRSVVPTPRSGTLLKFSARQNRSATLILIDAHDKVLPIGTQVYVNDNEIAQEVALRGKVFISEMDYPANIIVIDQISKAKCSFVIAASPTSEVFPTLGPYTCYWEAK